MRDRSKDEQDAGLHQEYALLHYGRALESIQRSRVGVLQMTLAREERSCLIVGLSSFV